MAAAIQGSAGMKISWCLLAITFTWVPLLPSLGLPSCLLQFPEIEAVSMELFPSIDALNEEELLKERKIPCSRRTFFLGVLAQMIDSQNARGACGLKKVEEPFSKYVELRHKDNMYSWL